MARIASGPDNFFTPAQTAKALEAGPKMLDKARRAHEGLSLIHISEPTRLMATSSMPSYA